MTSGEARGEAARRSAAEQRARRAHDLGLAAVITLGQALGGKDFYTFGHAARVAAYTRLLARALGWPDEEVQRAEQAAYVHDIGKLAISDRVLRKAGPLNDAEWAQMREHTVVSANVLSTLLGEEIAGGARHHHERFDGSGYPDGLTGRAIPEIASAICLADSYDAMSHTRPYRRALSYEEASLEVRDCAGSQFDSVMAAAFGDVLVALRRRLRRDAGRRGGGGDRPGDTRSPANAAGHGAPRVRLYHAHAARDTRVRRRLHNPGHRRLVGWRSAHRHGLRR